MGGERGLLETSAEEFRKTATETERNMPYALVMDESFNSTTFCNCANNRGIT